MVAYGEFRSGFDKDEEDTRLVCYGIRYIVTSYLARQWTLEDVDKAAKFFSTHLAPARGSFPFPRLIFERFVTENNGWFPIRLEALPEGTCCHAHVPVYQITAEGEYAPLCTFFETVLTQIWYPTTVATLSRRTKDIISIAFERSVEEGSASALMNSRLHDFGFRGCTCVEQSILGGAAHLLNFDGTDTMPAAYYVQFELNGGDAIASSVPATEHSVMTAWPDEAAAISNMIQEFGTGIFSCVMDSYDYAAALEQVLPRIAQSQRAAGGVIVLRPDSGDPLEAVIMGLKAGEAVFGVDVNSRGFKVPRKWGVIQGDGINITTVAAILESVLQEGFSAEAVTFGMGGGLLQRVNRDTMQFATKLCHIAFADGSCRDVAKSPKSDTAKSSFPGVLAVKRVRGIPTVFPADSGEVSYENNLLEVVYDCRPVQVPWQSFSEVRARVQTEWSSLPPAADVISQSLREKMAKLHAAKK